MLERSGENGFEYKLHGGTPMRMQWHFYGSSELPVAVQTWELPPGGFEGMHAHTDNDVPLEEIYIVTEGYGRLTFDDDVYDVGPGDAVRAPVGVPHDLRNTGDVTLKLVVVWGATGNADYSGFGSAKLAQAVRHSGG